MSDPGVLVLGLGNVLCGDDGVGVAAVRALARTYTVPAGVRVLDGGTLGLALLPYFDEVRVLLLVDAIRGDGPPGSLVRLEGDEVRLSVERLSVHQVGVADLLEAAHWCGSLPEHVVLLGIVPERIELGVELSAPVGARLDDLVALVVAELARHGVDLVPALEGAA